MKLQPVVLSGGSGTRLWPLSREKYPKQLLKLFGDETMLQATVTRMKHFDQKFPTNEAPIIVSSQEYRFITAEQLLHVGVDNAKIILEPMGKNTAPALTLAALEAVKNTDDAILLVMPADHLIAKVDEFYDAVAEGIPFALNGGVVCFGITPTRPDVGYGYIKQGKPVDKNVFHLDSFAEKPEAKVAQEYVDSGLYTWNSGIFMLKASTWLSAIEQLQPAIHSACTTSFEHAKVENDFIWVNAESFVSSPDDSIDYAVMEHLGQNAAISIPAYVVPVDAGWSDVGAWNAVWENTPKDEFGNVSRGEGTAVFHKTKNSLAHAASRRVVSVLGLEDVYVIDTMDAVLVTHKDALPEIKGLIKHLKNDHIQMTQHWRQVFRPWGSYDSIDSGDHFQVKRIIVNPGHVLSLQMHHHRAEHWIVVKGTGKITKGEETFILSENESTYIPLGVVHRLENPGRIPLELIEVQSGSYLGEDDIVRLEDVYGRANPEELNK